MTFLWLVLSVIGIVSIIVVGLFSFVVFIETLVNPSEIDNDFWKE
jgi:hypothetical protein